MNSRFKSLSQPKYRPDIDGLRAIAVVSVVAYHAFPHWISGGFIGVDVFFVISGFLISTIIFTSLDKGIFSFSEFYSRRIRRIFPALLIILILSYALGWFVLLADEYTQLGKHIASGAAFVSNLVLSNESGYFDNSAETKPLLHLWSLGIEEQFYIIWPLLLWLAWKGKFNFFLITVVVAIASFFLNVDGAKKDAVATFYSPQTRFWELMCGSLLAWQTLYKAEAFARIRNKLDAWLFPTVHFRGRGIDIDTLLANAFSFVGILLLAYGFWRIDEHSNFPGKWAVVPVLGAVLILVAGSKAWLNSAVLSNRWAVRVGLISYPLYLWHWPALTFARIVENEVPSTGIRLSAIFVSLLLALATYKFIEAPTRRKKTSKAVFVLSSSMALAFAVGLATWNFGGFPSRDVAMKNGNFSYAAHWNGWQSCDMVKAPERKNGGCKVLARNEPIDVLVIGDSHAGHLASGLRELYSGRRENVGVMLHAGCLPFSPVQIGSKTYFDCPGDLIENALEYAKTTQSVKTVILSGYQAKTIHGHRAHSANSLTEAESRQNLLAFDKGLTVTIDKLLKEKNKRVIFVLDNPELLRDPRSCIQRISEKNCDINITKKQYLKRNRDFLALVDRVRAMYPSVMFADSADALCDASLCFGYINGDLLYATRDHLNPVGSRYLIRSLQNMFISPQEIAQTSDSTSIAR